jgi:hypothetical protein
MKPKFDFSRVSVTEFGVGLGEKTEKGHKPKEEEEPKPKRYAAVPTDRAVKKALREMVEATVDAFPDEPRRYEPSEKHESVEHLVLPLDDDLAKSVRELHQASKLTIDATALSNPELVFCYFTRLTDRDGRRLTAIKRAVQFKGILKSRLLQFGTDALTIVDKPVFKLDNEFDLLADDETIHILYPSGFEYVGMLQKAVLAAVPRNVAAMKTALTFVDIDPLADYAKTHPRAAKLFASIRMQPAAYDEGAVRSLCTASGVGFQIAGGKMTVARGNEIGFLEVLDRRRYQVTLSNREPEKYRAKSRQRL